MNKLLTLITVFVIGIVLVACQPTNDSSSDSASAQSLQPNLAGYEVQNSDNIIDGFSTALAASALTSGNVPLAIAIERVNSTLECLENVGALSGQIYIQNENVQIVPQGGTTLIVNLSRVERNLFNCVTEQPLSAQALSIEPCFQTGTFTFEEEEFLYLYAGAGAQVCAAFNTHFVTGLGGTITSNYP